MYTEDITKMREFFQSGKTKDVKFRLESLRKLKKAIYLYKEKLLHAVFLDLGKVEMEAYSTELGLVLEEINVLLNKTKRWSKPKPVSTSIINFPSKSYIISEPFGLTLIMSPWNYPVLLTLTPLAAAIATGNCSVIKTSRFASNVSSVLNQMISDTFDPSYIRVFEGGRDVNEALLNQKFDFIFFTGSTNVGKVVMSKAAENLTPVVLELGGKSPVIVDETAPLKVTAKRIAWGKYINAGQTCVAPDYLIIHESKLNDFITHFKNAVLELYGENPLSNIELPKIINKHHFDRLNKLMVNGDILIGGNSNESLNKIEPTLIINPDLTSELMNEEIFGPILPVITYKTLDEVEKYINSKPHPLALYIFSKNKENIKRLHKNIQFGGGCVNDVLMHLTNSNLPFGGVGGSGMGNYHGKFGFDTFSHKKGILHKSLLVDIIIRYAPYKNKIKLIEKILK